MSKYTFLEGRQVDASIIEKAERLTLKSGDGRISKNDADIIFHHIVSDNHYTTVEEHTVHYILKNFKWTEAAKDHFNDRLKTWVAMGDAAKKPHPLALDDIDKQQFPHQDILDPQQKIEREHRLRAAMEETYMNRDDLKLIVRLADGRRVEIITNMIELEGDFVEVKGGHAIPIWAVEEVRD